MEYLNFDLSIDRNGEGYEVRARTDRFGEPHAPLGLDPVDPSLLEKVRIFDLGESRSHDFFKDLGEHLYCGIFRSGREQIEPCLTRCLSDGPNGGRVRIRLRIRSREIASVPWELLYSPDLKKFLAASTATPVVRYAEQPAPVRRVRTGSLHALIVMPDNPELQSQTELGHIRRALDSRSLRKKIRMTVLDGHVNAQRLEAALLHDQYHILHFIGHSDSSEDRGYLLLNGESPEGDRVHGERLATMVRNQHELLLVFLNSCRSVDLAPHLIEADVPAVVAMHFPIYDQAALDFSEIFYGQLFSGPESGYIDLAVSAARNTMYGREQPGPDQVRSDFAAPILFTRTEMGIIGDIPRANWLGTLADFRRLLGLKREQVAYLKQAAPDDPRRDVEARRLEEMGRRIDGMIRSFSFVALAIALTITVGSKAAHVLELEAKTQRWLVAAGSWISPSRFNDSIRFVDVTPRTEEVLGRVSPAYRAFHARILDKLSMAKARVVVFDMEFETPAAQDSAFAVAIASAMGRGTAVVVGCSEYDGRVPRVAPGLLQAGVTFGAVCASTADSHITGVPIALVHEGTLIPSLALAALCRARGQLISGDTKAGPFLVDEKTYAPTRLSYLDRDTVRTASSECPLIRRGDLVFHYAYDPSPIGQLREKSRHLEYEDVLNSEPGQLTGMEGRIVLIGGVLDEDLHDVPGLGDAPRRYGVELHADILSNLLDRPPVRWLGLPETLALCFLFGCLGLETRMHLARHGWARVFLPMLVIGVLCAVITALYAFARILVNPIFPILTILTSFLVADFFARLKERSEVMVSSGTGDPHEA